MRDWGGFEVGLGRFGEDFGVFEGDWVVNGWKMGEMFGGMGNFAYFCGVILMFFSVPNEVSVKSFLSTFFKKVGRIFKGGSP